MRQHGSRRDSGDPRLKPAGAPEKGRTAEAAAVFARSRRRHPDGAGKRNCSAGSVAKLAFPAPPNPAPRAGFGGLAVSIRCACGRSRTNTRRASGCWEMRCSSWRAWSACAISGAGPWSPPQVESARVSRERFGDQPLQPRPSRRGITIDTGCYAERLRGKGLRCVAGGAASVPSKRGRRLVPSPAALGFAASSHDQHRGMDEAGHAAPDPADPASVTRSLATTWRTHPQDRARSVASAGARPPISVSLADTRRSNAA